MFGKNKNKNTTRAPQIDFSNIPSESNTTEDSALSYFILYRPSFSISEKSNIRYLYLKKYPKSLNIY